MTRLPAGSLPSTIADCFRGAKRSASLRVRLRLQIGVPPSATAAGGATRVRQLWSVGANEGKIGVLTCRRSDVITQEFLKNRAAFPAEGLRKHLGSWVAFSADGRSIVAGAESLEDLERSLKQRQIDPQTVCFEYVPGPEGDLFTSPEAPQCGSPTKAAS